jgi:hypothetical protein
LIKSLKAVSSVEYIAVADIKSIPAGKQSPKKDFSSISTSQISFQFYMKLHYLSNYRLILVNGSVRTGKQFALILRFSSKSLAAKVVA